MIKIIIICVILIAYFIIIFTRILLVFKIVLDDDFLRFFSCFGHQLFQEFVSVTIDKIFQEFSSFAFEFEITSLAKPKLFEKAKQSLLFISSLRFSRIDDDCVIRIIRILV